MEEYFDVDRIFFVTEGINASGETYESTAGGRRDEKFLRALFEEFLEASKKGPARIMISNRKEESWG